MDGELAPLPDYLAPRLRLVFVGINPSMYSSQVGRYFAFPRNRFWQAFNASGLADGVFGPQDDSRLLERGIGFTDVVKRPTASAGDLRVEDFRLGAPQLKEKLLYYQPRVACFHGVSAYAPYLRYAEGVRERVTPGQQARAIGETRVFVAPNPSPANAGVRLDDLVVWYRRLRVVVEEAASG